MKRFYKVVNSRKKQDGYAIFLDGKPVKAKSGSILLAPNEDIAQEVVLEWAAQNEVINPETMPFTQILNTREDRVSKEREVMEAYLFRYLDTDLLCYIADTQDMAERQELAWKPWRSWFEKQSGTVLLTTSGLGAIKQEVQAHAYVQTQVKAMNDDIFTLFQIVTALCGSIILGLAFIQKEASANDVFTACTVEEKFKAELFDADKYGNDPLWEKQQAAARRDLDAAGKYLKLLT